MPPAESVTLELLGRIQDGDETAWTELYRAYHDELLFYVRANLGTRLRGSLESEDVLQSVALDAFRALPAFEHRGTGSLRAFLHTLVLNKIRNRAAAVSAKKRSGAVPLTDSMERHLGVVAAPTYHDSNRYLRLERCLASLSADMREIVILRQFDGLTSKEAAARLGKSDDATRKLFSRAMARLTMMLDEAAE